jgi:hypothetical protein
VQIEEDRLRHLAPRDLEALLPVEPSQRVEPGAREPQSDSADDLVVVVDDQDPRR